MIYSCSLQTGSNGNCFYVETPDARLLIDAGISGKQAQARLDQRGRDMWDVDAILISHNHSDHVRCAGVYQRKIRKPLYITAGAWGASKDRLGVVYDVKTIESGRELSFGRTKVLTAPTAHDGIDGVAFVICYGNKKLGIFTDLGHCFDGLDGCLHDLDGLYLESNYDPKMLADGPYPQWLKDRISGLGGHLSNREAAELIADVNPDLQWLTLSHLSEHNNRPALALETARNVLGRDYPVTVASRFEAGEMLVVS